MSISIAPIVEGEGDVLAVPILIRRLAQEFDPLMDLRVQQPIRRPFGTLIQPGMLERDVGLAGRIVRGAGAVLILVDCEDDCPARMGPLLLARAREARPDLPVGVVLAHREYESWFLAAADSLRGRRGLPANLTAPGNPESRRGAKEWLARQMPAGKYSELLDQPALTVRLDLAAARRSDSFDKCCREVTRLLTEARTRFG